MISLPPSTGKPLAASELSQSSSNTSTINREPPDPRIARKYTGGRGLGAKILTDEVDPKPIRWAPITS